MNLMRRLFFASLPVLGVWPSFAQQSALTPEQITTVVRVESVTIPTPGEFFTAIDKNERPSWAQLVQAKAPVNTSSRLQMALALGTLVADGYIAVEAEDGQSVKNIGKEIINLAKKLNVSQTVLGRGNSINDFASNSNWSALREELEATQNEVKLSMEEQKDNSLIVLVTVGAWLRGTEIISGLVAGTYTEENARLLRQPAIIDYLLTQLGTLPAAQQEKKLIVVIKETLEKSRSLVTDTTPSADNIKELHAIMAHAVSLILTQPSDQ